MTTPSRPERGMQAWQELIDAQFPDGAVAYHPDGTPVPVYWFRVVAMKGLDPVLTIYLAGGYPILPGRTVTSWNKVSDDPVTVEATFLLPNGAAAEPYQFVTPAPPLAAELRAQREAVAAAG